MSWDDTQGAPLVLKGMVGAFMPVFGVITSMQDQILWWLRVASLLVGLLVGIATLISIALKWRRPGPPGGV